MATLPFVCTATPLTEADFNGVVSALGVDAASVWALLEVESGKAGYLPDRRPQILFERAVFHTQTKGQYDQSNPGISAPTWGGYTGGAGEYTRLAEAYALNPDAALQSASWGISQVMGFNFSTAGYASPSDLVAAACGSEAAQLLAFQNFVQSTGTTAPLKAHNWITAATKYNGSGQIEKYAGQLQANFNALQNPSRMPDFSVRAAQLYLSFLSSSLQKPSYSPGGIDGQIGIPSRSKTLAALNAFQTDQGIATTTSVDDGVLASLVAALPPPPNLTLA